MGGFLQEALKIICHKWVYSVDHYMKYLLMFSVCCVVCVIGVHVCTSKCSTHSRVFNCQSYSN